MSVTRDNEVVDYVYGEYRCPKCQHPIVWALGSGRAGARAPANCTKHYTQSRIEFDHTTEMFCDWEGIVERKKCGGVEFFHPDGVTRIRKVSF